MLKREIVSLLEYERAELNSHFGDKPDIFSHRKQMEDILDYQLPKIGAITKELEVLDKELTRIKEEKKKALLYLQEKKEEVSKIICMHPVLFERHGFCGSSYRCILCNEKMDDLDNKVIIDEGYYDDDYFITNYSFMDIYEIFMTFLKDKDNNEEINLNKEFLEQFKLGNIGIINIDNNKYEKRYNILIINGSNIINIDNAYITRKNDEKVIEIYNYLEYMNRVSVSLLTSHLEGKIKRYNIIEFTTIDDLISKIDKSVNYDLIIDMSNLFTYDLVDEVIKIKNVNLNFKKMFPNSIIMKVYNDFKKNIEEALDENNASNDFKKLVLKR